MYFSYYSSSSFVPAGRGQLLSVAQLPLRPVPHRTGLWRASLHLPAVRVHSITSSSRKRPPLTPEADRLEEGHSGARLKVEEVALRVLHHALFNAQKRKTLNSFYSDFFIDSSHLALVPVVVHVESLALPVSAAALGALQLKRHQNPVKHSNTKIISLSHLSYNPPVPV